MYVADRHRIFIIEGLVTIFFSIFVFIFVPNFPGKDKWIKEEDREMLLARLEVDKGKEREDVSKGAWKKVVFDYRVWLMYVLLFIYSFASCLSIQDTSVLLRRPISRIALIIQPHNPKPTRMDIQTSASNDHSSLDYRYRGRSRLLLPQWTPEQTMAFHLARNPYLSHRLVYSLQTSSAR